MKIAILSIMLSAFLFAACNSASQKTETARTSEAQSTTAGAAPGSEEAPTQAVLMAYLQLKNALTKDNDKDAAEAGNSLVKAIETVDKASLTAEQSKVFTDIADDAKEHAEHIGANVGNIKHQREHFETLSDEIYELVKAGDKTPGKLYYNNCPMYNNGKGGNWISETKEIQNPYLGKEMLTCGTVKEELN